MKFASTAAVAHTRRLFGESSSTVTAGQAAINEFNTYLGLVESGNARAGVVSSVESRFIGTGVPVGHDRPT